MATRDGGVRSGQQHGRRHHVDSPKQRSSIHQSSTAYDYDDYSIAWICALHIEMAAAQAMLDEVHEELPRHNDDSNTYVLGRNGQHNIVITCLPTEQYGTNSAANVVTELLATFTSITAGLMVGIGGGVPMMGDIRLGDVVVGTRVMQTDLGKMLDDAQIQRTATARHPSLQLCKAVSVLRSRHELGHSQMDPILERKMRQYQAYQRPGIPDHLFKASYKHCSDWSNCDECDRKYLVLRSTRSSLDPIVHYGAIASANYVMRSGTTRDNIARELSILCFEMETSGIMDVLPCLPIRGICDYADSHKNKDWQRYAAAVAAAYATEFLSVLHKPKVPNVKDAGNSSIAESDDDEKSIQRRSQLRSMMRFNRIDSRRSNIDNALLKTCDWLLDHDGYKSWMNPSDWNKHRGFLWIKGKPGVGKSTIMKFAYRHQKAHLSTKDNAVVSFFFNARGEYLERSALGMYRSLLLQIIDLYPDLEIALDTLELSPIDPECLNSLAVLKNVFSLAVSRLSNRPLICFIDALDECDELQVLDMIQWLEEQAEICADNNTPLKVCFSSRHYPYIIIKWGIQIILENQPGHQRDMAQYIDKRLRISNPELVQELRSQIIEKSCSVFMWVVLVIRILNKEEGHGRLALRRRIQEIPSDLSKFFKSILTRDEAGKQQLLIAIRWILCAQRPLHPKEFYHAMWSGLSQQGLVDPSIPNGQESLDIINRSIVSYTKGLAEATASRDPIVQFIHESVRDFLLKEKGLQDIDPDIGFDWEGPSHDNLKQYCFNYMNQPVIWNAIQQWRLKIDVGSEPNVLLNDFPFLDYATDNVLHHSELATTIIPQDDFISSFVLSKWIELDNFSIPVERYGVNTDLLYVLADRGHPTLIRTVIRLFGNCTFSSKRCNSEHGNAFFAALAHRHEDCISALLDASSAQWGCAEVFALLGKQSYLKQRYIEGRTPLSWAAQQGLLDVARFLISQYGGVCTIDYHGRTPLSRAVGNGRYEMAKYLIQCGAIGLKGDSFMSTPLLLAAQSLDMITLLLDHGANVNTADDQGCTPLMKAATRLDPETIHLLLDRGANIHATDEDGETALTKASVFGHKNIISILLEHGADINICDWKGDTPLMKACLNRDEPDIVSLLIEKGANIESVNKKDETALMAACQDGKRGVAKLLLKKGANIKATDNQGRTALMKACEWPHNYNMVRLLLGNGAEVNASNNDGWTPLMIASHAEAYSITLLLLAYDARINVRNSKGELELTCQKITKWKMS